MMRAPDRVGGTLSAAISSTTATSFSFNKTSTNAPPLTPGDVWFALIENEIIFVNGGVTDNGGSNYTCTLLSSAARGMFGTTAATHASDLAVRAVTTEECLKVIASQQVPAVGNLPNFIVKGYQVFYTGTGLDYIVTPGEAMIDNNLVSKLTQTALSLSAADPTNPRIDVFAVGSTGTPVVVAGTAAASPSEPSVDPETQVRLTFAQVNAAATTPAGVSTEVIYTENAGTPTEWAAASNNATINVNSTSSPITATKSIEATLALTTHKFTGTRLTSESLAGVDLLAFKLKSKALWPTVKMLQLYFLLNGVKKSVEVTVKDGYWGFNSSNITDAQVIAIPAYQFSIPAGQLIDQFSIEVRGSGAGIGWRIDEVYLISGSDQPLPPPTPPPADIPYSSLPKESGWHRHLMFGI